MAAVGLNLFASEPMELDLPSKEEVEELKAFASELGKLKSQMGSITDLYAAAIQKASKVTAESFFQDRASLVDAFFKEFSRNNLGYDAPLQGTRGRILSLLSIPSNLQECFSEGIKNLIEITIRTKHNLELCGLGHKKMNPFFFELLCGVIKSTKESSKLSLKISAFRLEDAEAQQIIAVLNAQRVRTLDLGKNMFTLDMKTSLKDIAAQAPKITLRL